MRSTLLSLLSLAALTVACSPDVFAPVDAYARRHPQLDVSRLSDAALASILSSDRLAVFLEEHPDSVQMLMQQLEETSSQEEDDEAESDSAEESDVTAEPTAECKSESVIQGAVKQLISDLEAKAVTLNVTAPTTAAASGKKAAVMKGKGKAKKSSAVEVDEAGADSADDLSPVGKVVLSALVLPGLPIMAAAYVGIYVPMDALGYALGKFIAVAMGRPHDMDNYTMESIKGLKDAWLYVKTNGKEGQPLS